MKHKKQITIKLRALIIFVIFFTFSCKEENKNKISVITMVETTESIMHSVNYDKQQKQHLESKLIEARVNKKLSDSLLAINYSSYIGLPIGLLLDRIGNPEGYFFSGDPYGELGSCYLEYEDSIILRIAPKKLEYLKHYNSDNQWNMDTFRLEKIRYISINKGLEVFLFVDE